MRELANEQCRDEAEAALKRGDHRLAMRWYNTAAARTIGHTKTASYEKLAKDAAKSGGITTDLYDFAKDAEAVVHAIV